MEGFAVRLIGGPEDGETIIAQGAYKDEDPPETIVVFRTSFVGKGTLVFVGTEEIDEPLDGDLVYQQIRKSQLDPKIGKEVPGLLRGGEYAFIREVTDESTRKVPNA